MLNVTSTKERLCEYIHSFIWTFKIGDNVEYNLDVIFQLVDDYNSLEGRSYAKPISVLCVSVVEAVLVDFLERLDSATRHFPNKLNSKKIDIKQRLEQEKNDYETTYKGKTYKYKRLKNFGYKELIEFCKDFNILGSKPDTYKALRDLGRFRNRVHIRNYFGNFERDESRTFSEKRTQSAVSYMEAVLKYFSENYPRP